MTADAEKKVVLVVDDAPANIRIVNEILHDSYKIRIATNGAKGLELARGTPGPDLSPAGCDHARHGCGYDVCTRLKASPSTRDIPVIFLTGQTETTDETRGFEVGAVDYIHKPFSPAVVAARVRTHLALRETRDQLDKQLQAIRAELETARQIQLSILPPGNAVFCRAGHGRAIPSHDLGGGRLLRLHADRRAAHRYSDRRCIGTRYAGGTHRIDAESGVCGAGGQGERSGGGVVRPEPGSLRKVSRPLRDGGLCVEPELDTRRRGL